MKAHWYLRKWKVILGKLNRYNKISIVTGLEKQTKIKSLVAGNAKDPLTM